MYRCCTNTGEPCEFSIETDQSGRVVIRTVRFGTRTGHRRGCLFQLNFLLALFLIYCDIAGLIKPDLLSAMRQHSPWFMMCPLSVKSLYINRTGLNKSGCHFQALKSKTWTALPVIKQCDNHYSDVAWASWRLILAVTRLLAQELDLADNKKTSKLRIPLCTESPVTVGCSSQRACNRNHQQYSQLRQPRIFFPSGHCPETATNTHVSTYFR